ncbi:MAG: lysophospholipid acyltransferase family protein [Bacteroidota bacterium]
MTSEILGRNDNMAIVRRLRPPFYSFLTVPVFALLYTYSGVLALVIWTFAFSGQKRAVRTLIRFWAISIFLIMGKHLHVTGTENIVRGKKYIVLANHASLFDITAILAFYPGVSWFGREHLLKVPVFGHILKMIDYIPMTDSDISNTKRMLGQLVKKSEGKSVAMFPEGTRTLDGNLNRFKRGFIHLLRSTELAVLPVTLNGFHSLKPKNRFWIDFHSKVEVIIHKPIENHLLKNKEDHEILELVKETIQSAYLNG